MRKQKFYTLYSFNQKDFEKNNKKSLDIKEENLVTKEVRLAENFLVHAYCNYKNITFENNMLIPEIIKVMLDNNEYTAREQCKKITFNDENYIAWFATTSGMKKEDQEEGKCEILFIREDLIHFVETFEDITSLGKIKEQEGKEICINKDILSRLSLATSSSHMINYNPKVVVLPETEYKYVANYYTFKPEAPKTLVPMDNCETSHVAFDGAGFMSPKMADIIKDDLKVDYNVDFAIIRQYGTATKGLVVKVDFLKYFKENYNKNTEYFKKENDVFYVKDRWNNWININEVDLILNDSMVKWAKWWDSVDEIEEELFKDEYDNYRDILSNLYVTKINKENTKEYTLSNYQLISNLALLPDEIAELSKDTEEIYERIQSWDINAIRIFLGDIAREDQEQLSASTKNHQLLQMNEDFINMAFIKKSILRLIRNQIKLLASGKFYLKGNYKTIAPCPVKYLDWIMNRDIDKDIGLKKREYYVPKNTGKRTISRNPLAVFSEIQNIELNKSKELDDIVGNLTDELIFVNMKDNTLALSSGADMDGDTYYVVENEIIYNAVVPPKDGRCFLNLEDDKSLAKELVLNKENRIEAILKASGNLIGEISDATIKIANRAQVIGYVKDNQYYSNEQMLDVMFEDKTFLGGLLEYVKKENIPKADKVLDKEAIRKEIVKQYHYYQGYSYYALQQSMKAIDSPKTLQFPTREELKPIEKFLDNKCKKPRFMFYAKPNKKKKWEDFRYMHNAININADKISNGLLDDNRRILKVEYNDNVTRLHKAIKTEDIENIVELKSIIQEMFNSYKDKYNGIKAMKSQLEARNEYNKELDSLDLRYLREAEEIESKFDYKEICNALVLAKASSRFILKFFYTSIIKKLSDNCTKVTVYKECEDGEIEFRFKKYAKGEIEYNAEMTAEKLQQEMKNMRYRRLDMIHDIRVCIQEDSEITDIITLKEEFYKDSRQATLYNSNGEKIGFIFKDCNKMKNSKSILDFIDKQLKIEDIKVAETGKSFRAKLISKLFM